MWSFDVDRDLADVAALGEAIDEQIYADLDAFGDLDEFVLASLAAEDRGDEREQDALVAAYEAQLTHEVEVDNTAEATVLTFPSWRRRAPAIPDGVRAA